MSLKEMSISFFTPLTSSSPEMSGTQAMGKFKVKRQSSTAAVAGVSSAAAVQLTVTQASGGARYLYMRKSSTFRGRHENRAQIMAWGRAGR